MLYKEEKLLTEILCNSATFCYPSSQIVQQAFTASVPALMINFLLAKLRTWMNAIFLCVCYIATVI